MAVSDDTRRTCHGPLIASGLPFGLNQLFEFNVPGITYCVMM
jgi:hypothetical protein